MKMRLLTTVLATVLAVAAFGVFQQQTPNPKLPSWVGKKLPTFSMKGIDGKTITNSSLKGKVIMFDFWATWCAPCKAASPSVDAIAKKYKSKGLVVVGATYGDESGNAKKYQKEHGYSYTFVDSADKLAGQLGINVIPAFVVVDKQGVVRKVFTGYGKGDEKKFEKAVADLLK